MRGLIIAAKGRVIVLTSILWILLVGVSGPAQARDIVSLDQQYQIGAIVIDHGGRELYYSLGHGRATK